MDLEEINLILDQARNSISNYCINDCKALCCRKGKLLLQSENEIKFISQGKENKFLKRKILQKTNDGNFTFNHERVKCPYLTNDFKCSTWKDSKMTKVWKNFL